MKRKPIRRDTMTADEFLEIQDMLGVTNAEMAEKLNSTERSVENWRRESRAIPGPVARLMRIYGASVEEEIPESVLRERLEIAVEAMRAIERNDKTSYNHHEARPFDGKIPDEIDGGTCFLTPREISQYAIAEIWPGGGE
ncbi:MAG: hypothetical protein P1V51_19810 [Deltaproteobacteria bacterium]|nr:hypothetical protein [Deltaproteobacteria bacterium]